MLAFVRRYSGTLAMKLVFGLLALSFIVGFALLTTSGSQNTQQNTIVVYVDKKPITNLELERTYNRMYQTMRAQYQDQLTEDVLKSLNLRYQAISMLINQEIALKEAAKLGLSVSDQELRDAILSYPVFHNENGTFDDSIYQAVLSQQRPPLTPAIFEREQRRQILLSKFQDYIQSFAQVTQTEVLQTFLSENRTADLEFLRFRPSDLQQGITLTNSEIEQYYQANSSTFETGERANIAFIQVSALSNIQDMAVSEEEVSKYYEDHRENYRVDERVRANHILIKVDESTSDDAAKSKIESLLERIKDGEAFADVAKQESQDASAAQGGDLGWFGRGQMVKEFETAAFAAQKGDVVGPVRTQFGYHLIEVIDHEDGGIPTLDTIKPRVEIELKREKSSQIVEQKLAEIEQQVNSGQTLEALAKANSLDYKTLWLAQKDLSRNPQIPADISSRVFDTENPLKDKGEMIKTTSRLYFVQVLERGPSILKPLAEVRPRIEQELKKEKSITLAAEQAAQALTMLQNGKSIASVAKTYATNVQTTGAFTAQDDQIPSLGSAAELKTIAFSLTKQNPLPKSSYKVGDDYVVIRLLDKHEPTKTDWEEKKEALTLQLLQAKQQKAFESWMLAARAQIEIKWENPPSDIQPMVDLGS